MADKIPQWAVERALAVLHGDGPGPGLLHRDGAWVQNFARYIAEREQPPVDPLLAEAKALVIADGAHRTANQVAAIQAGTAGQEKVAIAIAALRRGIEIGEARK